MKAARDVASTLTIAFALVLASCADQPTHVLDGTGGNGAQGQGGDGAGVVQGTGGSGHGAGNAGGNGQGGDPTAQPATFEVTVSDDAAQIELRDSVELTVSVAPNGYVGSVLLNVEGLPDDVDGELSTTSVDLDGSSTESVTLRISSLSSTVTGDYPFTVRGTVEAGDKTDTGTITVQPVITIIIPQDLASFSSNPADTTAFGDFPTVIKALPNMSPENTITVYFYNDDDVTHEIHADNDAEGFGHDAGLIQPNSMDPTVRHVNSAGSYGYYPHDLGTSILGQIDIQ